MKTLLNPTGGRPIKNEDLTLFEQFVTMYNDLFGRINAASNEFIISGCDIVGSDVSAGLIYYDGDICTFAGATSVSFPLAMEKADVESAPRKYFDAVVKNNFNTVTIAAQVGGGFSLSPSTPRLENFMLRKATTTEGQTGTNDLAAITSLTLLDALRNGASFEASTTNKGVVEKATAAEAKNGNVDKFPDAFTILTEMTASTATKGVVEKATTAEAQAGAADKYIDAELLKYKSGGAVSLNTGWTGTLTAKVNVLNQLEIIGNVTRGATGGAVIATLAAGYRPPVRVTGECYGSAFSDKGEFIIETSGVIETTSFTQDLAHSFAIVIPIA